MNGLFGNVQMNNGQPVHPDVAAAMGAGMGHPVQEPGMGNGGMPPPPPPPQQAATPNAMSPDQQALSEWLAQQEQAKQAQQEQASKPKYSVGDPNLDKYINMFLP